MTTVEFYKFLHVLFAAIWLGGAVLTAILGLRMKTASPDHRAGFISDMRFVGTWVFLPATVLTYLFGSLQVEEISGYDYDQTWILIATVCVLVVFLGAVGFTIPQVRRAIRRMDAGDGPGAAAIVRRVTLASRAMLVVLLVALWAMIFKPGL